MELSEANSPLLNEYKLEYLLRILPQTFLGGLRLRLSFKAPWYTYILQLLLWSYPFLVGCIFTMILELSPHTKQNWLYAIIVGTIIFISHLSLNITLIHVSKKKPSGTRQTTITNNFLMEDDEIIFTKCLSLSTLDFIVPKKTFLINLLIHPLFSAVTSAFVMLFLLPNRTTLYFGNNTGSVIYCIIGWLISCIALYPLVGQRPKEPNMFSFNDSYELAAITRTFYVLLLAVIDLFDYTTTSCHLILRIIFLLCPLFWVFGLLPTAHVLVTWCGEQLLVHVLGGSPMSSDLRLVLSFVCSWVAIIISYFIPDMLTSILVTSMLAVFLSTDFSTIILRVIKRLRIGTMNFHNLHIHTTNNNKENSSNRTKHHHLDGILLRTSALLSFIVLVTGLVVGLTKYFYADLNTSLYVDFLSYMLVVFVLLSECFCWCKHMFIFFSVLKNPMFELMLHLEGKWNTFMMIVKFVVDKMLLPTVLVLLTSIFIHGMDTTHHDFINMALIFRNYRMIWQDTNRYKFDILVFIITHWCDLDWYSWKTQSLPIQLFIISMVVHWIKASCQKIWFIVLLTYSSKMVEGNKRKVNLSILTTLLTLPLLVVVVLASTALSSPLLPLFTLPLFIIGYPRPLRMWPNAGSSGRSSSTDWIYYQQLSPVLQQMLEKEFNYGALSKCRAGDYLLARFQDRLIWISVLEHGLFYHNIVVKGLELQETSCHTAEAESIDEVFNSGRSKINKYFMHTLTPVTQAKLRVYSDAKSVLTGVIDNPTFLDTVSSLFPKILLCLSMKHFKERCKLGMDDLDDSSLQIDSSDMFHYHDDGTGKDALSTVISDSPFPVFPITSSSDSRVATVETNFTTTTTANTTTGASGSEDGSDDEFGDFGFGDDAEDGIDESDASETESPVLHHRITGGEHEKHCAIGVSKKIKIIDPPTSWLQTIPFGEPEMNSVNGNFTAEFFNDVVDLFCQQQHQQDEIKSDYPLIQTYRRFILNCVYLVEKADGSCVTTTTAEKSRHCFRMFQGKIPWSPRVGWLDKNKLLKDMVIRSYRMAVKLAYDLFILGLDDVSSDELFQSINEFEEDWYIGLEENEEWFNSVLRETQNLFTIGKQAKDGVYTSRLLSIQDLPVSIGWLDGECVRGIWSALTLELFYLTNDDEERYSIQAMPNVLRNIVTQAADPPLGYPVYTSGLLNVGLCF